MKNCYHITVFVALLLLHSGCASWFTKQTSPGLIYLETNSQGFKEYLNKKDGSILIEIPAGPFSMGSNSGEDNEKPVHTVYLDKYYIGKYEITVRQYRKFCSLTGKPIPGYLGESGPDNHPIQGVISWNEAKAYCDWAGLRLPTEAEWEKVARGTDGRSYPWGNGWDGSECNHGKGAPSYTDASDGYSGPAPVGVFSADVSPYGTYDMAGNVKEWCNDWFGNNYYVSSPSSNPTGPSSGESRVVRGGGFYDLANNCRTAIRFGISLRFYGGDFGFRPAK